MPWKKAVSRKRAFGLGKTVRHSGPSLQSPSIHDSFKQHVGFANVTRDITERKQAEERLRLRDRAIASFTQGVVITDPTQSGNPIVYVNDSFTRITGYSREEVIGKNCRFLQGSQTSPDAIERIRSTIREGRSCLLELLNYRKDGTPFWNTLSITALHDAAGRLTNFVGVQTDTSSFKLLEQKFHQAQKMEAIGQLAAGVAHDFNNLLTVITGYCELLLEMTPSSDPKRDPLEAINKAGERAAGLTRQLLSFSRKAILEMRVVNLNHIVKETEKLLRRIIGEDVLLNTILDPGISLIKVDQGQMGQVLLNLAVNARDAMPQGGKITITTSNIRLDEAYTVEHDDCKPGPYVRLAVSDDGCGMTSEVQSHLFEPFYTTKGPGRGTGLGSGDGLRHHQAEWRQHGVSVRIR